MPLDILRSPLLLYAVVVELNASTRVPVASKLVTVVIPENTALPSPVIVTPTPAPNAPPDTDPALKHVPAVTIPENMASPALSTPIVTPTPVGAPTLTPPRAVTIPVESTFVTSS